MSQVTPGEGDAGRTDARARLVDAAVEAFAARGFHGTTTRDIASAAGMSPAALYVHHRSKEDLLYLISRAGHERTLDLVMQARASTADPVQQLVAVIRDFTLHHAVNHTSARIVNYELAALSADHLEQITHMRKAIEREMRDLVAAGVAAGAFHTSSPRMTALSLLSLGVDVARWYRDDGDWSPEAVAEHYCELALRIVGAR
jgi:AcrR family transcriptional regulator